MGRIINDGYIKLFNSKILERGVAYYDAGKVGQPSVIAENLWHAVVRGTEDYQVDIRLRNGNVVSAACTCPYAQRAMYCKHVAAVLTAMEAMQRGSDDSPFPDDALNCVMCYARREFPGRGLNEADWQSIRHIFETLLCVNDLYAALTKETLKLLHEKVVLDSFTNSSVNNAEDISTAETRREARRAMENDYESRHETLYEQHESRYRARVRHANAKEHDENMANMRLIVPFVDVSHFDELPHTWMTILEASYEYLHDAEGLRRLYIYYILIAQTDPEAVYVQKLRNISGEHWQEDCDEIVRLYEKCRIFEHDAPTNPAYERLLREEGLSDAAKRYCRIKSTDILVRMLDVVAVKPDNAHLALAQITRMLGDPDAPIYERDDSHSAMRVKRWLRKVEAVYGLKAACDLAAQIKGMFPSRTTLMNAVEEYLPSDSDSESFDTDDDADDADDADNATQEETYD